MIFHAAYAFALALLSARPAAVNARPSPQIGADSQCSTGALHCCNSVEPPHSDKLAPILDALMLQSDQHVGLSCSPIPVSSVGGSPTCNASPVCCNGNSYGGISLGCTPVSLL